MSFFLPFAAFLPHFFKAGAHFEGVCGVPLHDACRYLQAHLHTRVETLIEALAALPLFAWQCNRGCARIKSRHCPKQKPTAINVSGLGAINEIENLAEREGFEPSLQEDL